MSRHNRKRCYRNTRPNPFERVKDAIVDEESGSLEPTDSARYQAWLNGLPTFLKQTMLDELAERKRKMEVIAA